jgi:dihydrofolate synthase/folylpolyglutamate synthase
MTILTIANAKGKKSMFSDSEKHYNEAINWLFSLRRFGSKPGLKYVNHLLSLIGNPHNQFISVHISGTNGKGSTTNMVASILVESGFKVGMFTSPHLSSFTERIQINGHQIPIKDVLRLVDMLKPFCEEMESDPNLRHPTFFEIITAIAFKYFSEMSVDIAVLEVGMGGLLDATNVVTSLVSIITNVSLEHTEVLGDTVLEIAEKKAGIIKKGGILITATQNDEVYALFQRICKSVGSKFFRVGIDIKYEKLGSEYKGQRFRVDGIEESYNDLFLPLLGGHQIINAATAIGAIESLKFHGIYVSKVDVRNGLKNVEWPGRLEIVQKSPMVVLDGAKDIEAMKAVKGALLTEFSYKKLVAVVSISSEKKIGEMIEILSQIVDHFVVTKHSVMERAADPLVIVEKIKKYAIPNEIFPNPKNAVARAIQLAGKDGMVIVLGSVFLIGDVRDIWHESQNPFSYFEK